MTMWNLAPVADLDARAHLDLAFQNNEVTEEEKTFLIGLYQQYVATLGTPSAELQGLGRREELYELVYNAYSLVQDNRRLKKLRSDLKLLANYCPYCGFAPVSDLDHHLQRGRFHLLSIFALNLVPCCAPCNTGKRKKPSDDPGEHQLHTYLENVSQYDFLRAAATVHPGTGALEVTYSIEQCAGMSDLLHRRLKTHLSEFDLHAKYAKQVNIHLSAHEFALVSSFKVGGAELLREYLEGTAQRNAKNFGINDWRTALFKGLAASHAFCSGGFKTALGITDSGENVPMHAAAA